MDFKKLRFRLVYDNDSQEPRTYAEYSTNAFKALLIDEWTKIKNAGDRVEVISRAFDRACHEFNMNAVSLGDNDGRTEIS